MQDRDGTGHGRRRAAAAVAVVLLGALAWFWAGSLLPGEFSVTDRAVADLGGGPTPHHGGGEVSVAALTADPDRTADVTATLVARSERVRLAGGREVEGYTLNGTSPGPTITARPGDLVEVRLVNESVADGTTLHWHGVDVPNAVDGVAGVTQDAVGPGEEHVYRFVADQVGTFWYHSHQVSHEQVRRGLLGALVVSDEEDAAQEVALVHTYAKRRTVNGVDGFLPRTVAAGATARTRVVNTDDAPMGIWVSGSPFRVVAVDGTDVNQPSWLTGTRVSVPAGGRVDLEVRTPASGAGARVELGGTAAVVLGPPGADPAPTERPSGPPLDLLTYGSPLPLGPVGEAPTRVFDYTIDARFGLLDGRPGAWWTVNGRLYPDVPQFVVTEGDVVRMRITNSSGEVHPMHLHGHHVVVLSRNGEPATGSPWWVDSLDVLPKESYEVAFVADNPGIWMDHCHNLPHAVEGLLAHVVYAGVTTPYAVGGHVHNQPE